MDFHGSSAQCAIDSKNPINRRFAHQQQAAQGAVSAEDKPTLVADCGVEDVNSGVDGLIESGLLSRVLPLRDVTFSNSMIEAWWRTLKHQW